MEEKERKGMESGGVFCKCSKISALKIWPAGRQRLTICQSLPRRGVTQLLPQMVLLSCPASTLNSLASPDGSFCPWSSQSTWDFFCWVVFLVGDNCSATGRAQWLVWSVALLTPISLRLLSIPPWLSAEQSAISRLYQVHTPNCEVSHKPAFKALAEPLPSPLLWGHGAQGSATETKVNSTQLPSTNSIRKE